MQGSLPRKLATILYADVAGYSKLTGEDEEGTHRRLSEYLDIILQEEMTQTIAGALEPELNAAERQRAVAKSPENLDSWEMHQRALWHMWTYKETSVATAMDLFQQINQADPKFAPA